MRNLGILILFVGIMIGSVPADATIWDFTSDSWQAVEGKQTYTNQGITLTATGGSMTWNNEAVEAADPQIGDGIGISRRLSDHWDDDNDEIDSGESLTISFSSTLTLQSFSLLDFFKNANAIEASGRERAEYRIRSGQVWQSWQFVLADDLQETWENDGHFLFHFESGVQANAIQFQGIDWTPANDGDSNYSVANITAVPIPGAIWLLASGLLGLLGFRKRQKH